MKHDETSLMAKKKYVVVMFMCFLYGGYSLISVIYQLYNSIWVTDVIGTAFNEFRVDDFNRFLPDINDLNRKIEAPMVRKRRPDAFEILSSPQSLSYLFGGIVSILAGLAIFSLIREKEIKNIKKQVAENLMLPDEKIVVNFLKKSGFEATQAKLAKETGLNKVQVHRVLKRLESKGIVQKHSYGLTNKIILKKELFE